VTAWPSPVGSVLVEVPDKVGGTVRIRHSK
jgi:hypothetical protein